MQALAQDKEGLMKLKKTVKDIQQSGTSELSSSYNIMIRTKISNKDKDKDTQQSSNNQFSSSDSSIIFAKP